MVIRFNRSTQRYIAKRSENILLRMRIKDIAQVRVRYGYKRIHVLLLREGWRVSRARLPKVDVTRINQCSRNGLYVRCACLMEDALGC